MNNCLRALLHVLMPVMALATLVGCGPTPEPQVIIETVVVEKVVTIVETVEVEKEVEVTVVETVEVEKEVTVVKTVEVERTVVVPVVTLAPDPTAPTPEAPGEPTRETVEVERTVVVPTVTRSVESELAEIDRLLERTVEGNIAHNVPSAMKLEETIDIQLLLSPSLAGTELKQRIAGPDPVRTASVKIAPEMQAELWAEDPDAFDIQPYHAEARQLVSSQEPTEWKWAITARRRGLQRLNLTLHRVVKYSGEDHWRKLQEYETTIQVKVTFGQWLAGLDWEFVVATIIAILGLPLAMWKLLGRRLDSLWERFAHRREGEGH